MLFLRRDAPFCAAGSAAGFGFGHFHLPHRNELDARIGRRSRTIDILQLFFAQTKRRSRFGDTLKVFTSTSRIDFARRLVQDQIVVALTGGFNVIATNR